MFSGGAVHRFNWISAASINGVYDKFLLYILVYGFIEAEYLLLFPLEIASIVSFADTKWTNILLATIVIDGN